MKQQIIAVVWFVMAVMTYGHAYHNQVPYSVRFDGSKRESDSVEKGTLSLMSSIAWPLYWSQVFWSEK